MGRKVIGIARRMDPTRSWPTRWRVMLSFGLIVAVSAIFIQNVLAVHDTGVFQLDGDASSITDPFDPPSPAATDDWDNVCYEAVYNNTAGDDSAKASAAIATCGNVGPTSGALGAAWSAEPNAASTIFTGGGSKDPQDISNWLWKDDGNNPPDKDNLIHAYAARYSLPPSETCPSGGTSSCEVLYFGSDRFDNSGDAQQGFWFLQSKVEAVQVKSGGGFRFSGVHKPGDVLAISDFSNGGTTSTITVLKWDPPRAVDPLANPIVYTGCSATNKAVDPTSLAKTVTDPSCKDANLRLLADLQGPAAYCRTTGNADPACGIVNPITITMPWQFQDKTPTPGNGALNGEFYEAGLNLSQLGLGDECFSSVVAETRTSTSTTATLKDFVVGQLGSCETTLTTEANLNAGGTSIISTNTSSNGTSPSGTDAATLVVKGVQTWSGTLEFYICGPFALNSSSVCNASGVKVLKAGETTGTPVSNTLGTTYTSGSTTLTSAGRYCWFAKFTPDSATAAKGVGSSRVDLQACKLEYSIVSPK